LDQMQEELSRFIADCMQENPSEASVNNMSHMLRMVDELESISDSCHNIGELLEKKRSKQIVFTKDMHAEIEPFVTEVRRFLQFIRNNLNRPMASSEFSEAHEMEKTINSFRNTLKKASRKRIQNGSNVRMEIMYIDILQQLEHMGDFALNIARELKETV